LGFDSYGAVRHDADRVAIAGGRLPPPCRAGAEAVRNERRLKASSQHRFRLRRLGRAAALALGMTLWGGVEILALARARLWRAWSGRI